MEKETLNKANELYEIIRRQQKILRAIEDIRNDKRDSLGRPCYGILKLFFDGHSIDNIYIESEDGHIWKVLYSEVENRLNEVKKEFEEL